MLVKDFKRFLRTGKYTAETYERFVKSVKRLEFNIVFQIRKMEYRKYGVKTLELLAETINDNELDCFPAFGTLLGLLRDNKLIPHDFDLDFGILDEKPGDEIWWRVTKALEASGFRKIHSFQHDGLVQEIAFYSPLSKFVTVDFFRFSLSTDGKNNYKYAYIRFDTEKYENINDRTVLRETLPRIYGFEMKKYYDAMLKIPKNAEELIEASYTKDWRIPNPKWKDSDKPNDRILKDTVGSMYVY